MLFLNTIGGALGELLSETGRTTSTIPTNTINTLKIAIMTKIG